VLWDLIESLADCTRVRVKLFLLPRPTSSQLVPWWCMCLCHGRKGSRARILGALADVPRQKEDPCHAKAPPSLVHLIENLWWWWWWLNTVYQEIPQGGGRARRESLCKQRMTCRVEGDEDEVTGLHDGISIV
jgi:hypothetical protein